MQEIHVKIRGETKAVRLTPADLKRIEAAVKDALESLRKR